MPHETAYEVEYVCGRVEESRSGALDVSPPRAHLSLDHTVPCCSEVLLGCDQLTADGWCPACLATNYFEVPSAYGIGSFDGWHVQSEYGVVERGSGNELTRCFSVVHVTL